ncbi:hypothetical protein JBE27_52100, partial [Streptomyces albiflaviniger]|nr:hypothetical protein [Streptomyces albiflaviniger]
WTPLGAPFPATAGKWIGATLGLFATGPATGSTGGVATGSTGGVATGGTDDVATGRTGGAAEFDWFRVGPISS